MQEDMTIGHVAVEAGVNVETVRFYQRRGLLEVPRKPFRGRRSYSPEAVKRIRFIKRAQSMGFSLDEILSLLRADGADCCSSTRDLAQRKLDAIEQKLVELSALRDALAALVRQCGDANAGLACPIITVLGQDE